ncbi:MAG: hypothetical protein MUO31_00885 [Thermodesulfovibrionales bacterium]|nr:hypothetical protein [Thermodesulfovibrionales bacterium]
MYKLLLHPTEKPSEERPTKAFPLLIEWLENSPINRKEFLTEEQVDNLPDKEYDEYFSSDKENPDLLVQRINPPSVGIEINGFDLDEEDYCAFEFKFGADLVSSLNSGLLQDELTRMKAKYSRLDYNIPSEEEMQYASIGELERFVKEGETALNNPSYLPTIPLYLVIVQEWIPDPVRSLETIPVIFSPEIMWAVGIALDLNIRPVYCHADHLFAQKVFKLIRTPPKEVDLGQRFVKKSSGSDWNQALQCYGGVSKDVANKMEHHFPYLLAFSDCYRNGFNFNTALKDAFTTDSGWFMKANMKKFIKKVSGQ